MNNIRKYTGRIIKYALIIMLTAVFLLPVVATITNSFMTGTEIRALYSPDSDSKDKEKSGITLIPGKLALDQYYDLLLDNYEYINKFWNSVKLSVSITLLHVILSIITAFVFAKLEFKGRDTIFFFFIVVMMMPFQVTLLPNYIQAKFLHTYNTYFAIILPGIFAPFGVFLLRQFMKYIPDEFMEAVALESNSVWDTLRIGIIPAVKPGIIALIVLTFAENWNMVEQPLVLLEDNLKYPLSVSLNSIIGASSNIAFAGSVVYMIPIIILYFYFEEYIVKGLSNARF